MPSMFISAMWFLAMAILITVHSPAPQWLGCGFVSGLQRGAANVPEERVTRPAHDVADRLWVHGLLSRLLEQVLEVRRADPVVAAHGGDRGADVFVGQSVAGESDFFGACRHQTHGAAQMGVDVGGEELEEQRVKVGMDEARLR